MSVANGAARFYVDGRPNHAEFAYSALTNMFGAHTREEADKWATAAQVHGLLAQREANHDLARALRENAAASQAMADELRARRT